ncbi:unnamed protein product [Rotaria sordida]|uniref:Uncharacterized protein n=1 Tax=Rotaria sordida TaxID=392033 RepID=A0A819LEE9_9BILA|nr:unnamed protein product [Rotaria sordida]CAF3960526.1 unnamed protein product [Rotaria sordida]
MSRRQDRQQEKELFRSLVLLLHRQNPSWTTPDVADFFEQSDNPPNLNRHALVNKIHYIVARGIVCERNRSGRPRTTTTAFYKNLFTLESYSNPHNEGVWTARFEEIPSTSRGRPRRKFASGTVFWGGISYEGLIPKNDPIDVTSRLKKQPTDKNKRTYMNDHLYAKFIKEVAHPEIQKVCGRDLIFQDDADSEQRTKIVLRTGDKLSNDRILPEAGDAKFANVWLIENIWRILKEKIQGEQFSSFEQLKMRLNKEWKKINCDDCKKLIDKIPNRLGEVIKNGGEQIHYS